jgi:hypothetical protein
VSTEGKRKLMESAAAVNTVTAPESDDQHKVPPQAQAERPGMLPHKNELREARDERPEAHQKHLLSDYLDEYDLARELNVTPRTLRLWRMRRTGPAWGRIGKRVIYNIEAVRTWLASLDKPQRSRRAA